MRIELPQRHARFGALRIHELTRVVELDSGLDPVPVPTDGRLIQHVPGPALGSMERDMAIVVPTKNEPRPVLDGVLSGIPHDCLIVLVSASDRRPIDRYAAETRLLHEFSNATGRSAVALHQGDHGVAAAVRSAGMGGLVEGDGIRAGKGEAMVLGLLITEMTDRRYVGFVDADNYVPGAVHEYVKCFAAGLHLAPTPSAMVRISWQSKPKVEAGRLVFSRWGRTSQVTNRFLNSLLSGRTGAETTLIATGNAGEHAITMDLARRLRFAGGFAAEPFELIEMIELFGEAWSATGPEAASPGVDVFQVETRNPHFHEDKGDAHVAGMRTQALNAVYHSESCSEDLRGEIRRFLHEEEMLPEGHSPPRPDVYRPIGEADVDAFAAMVKKAASYTSIR